MVKNGAQYYRIIDHIIIQTAKDYTNDYMVLTPING
jgi:hypothetical protein